MTAIHRFHLFYFLNHKVYYASTFGLVDLEDGTVSCPQLFRTKSFGRAVDWILDVVDFIVYEWLGLGYFIENLKFKKIIFRLMKHGWPIVDHLVGPVDVHANACIRIERED